MLGSRFAFECGGQPLLNIDTPHSLNGRHADIESVANRLIGPTWLTTGRIGFEQDTRMGQSLRGGLAVLREFEQLGAFFRFEFDYILLLHEALFEL